ncbi:MAG: Rab family GTPase [Promethearchaeota archaeon]
MKKIWKVVLLGDEGVGKRALLDRFVMGCFYTKRPMLGLATDILTKKIIMDDEKINLQFWYNKSLIEFTFRARTLIRGASGLMLIYDITNALSFKNLVNFLEIIQKNVDIGEDVIPKILLGCKADLEDDRAVSKQEARAFAHEYDINVVFESSAKKGLNVEESFLALTSEIKRAKRLNAIKNKEILEGRKEKKCN